MINTHVVLCMSLEYRWSKKLVCWGALCTCWIPEEQKPDRLISWKFPLCWNPNTAGAILSRAVELHRRSLIWLCCPSEPPLTKMALRRRAPLVYFRRAGANCSVGNPPPGGNPGITNTHTDPFLRKFDWRMNFKLKTTVQTEHTNFRSIQQRLPQSRETILWSSVAEPEPHLLVGARAVTRCSSSSGSDGSSSNNGIKHS
jgi:hypothetical protein